MPKSSRKLRTPIPHASLAQGYGMAVDNGLRLLQAAMDLTESFPDKSLAVAQVGQEEVGKSSSLLAAFALPQDSISWAWFWSGWRSHNLKAHRAFLYELLNPTRIELIARDKSRYSGQPLRATIPREKESGLYVEFDETTAAFVAPSLGVTLVEAVSRCSTLLYLGLTSDAVRRALMDSNSSFRLAAFGEIAFRICSENIYQQDVPNILMNFEKRSAEHKRMIEDLNEAFTSVTKFLSDLVTRPKP
jgi:AbiV family abortive infection protein